MKYDITVITMMTKGANPHFDDVIKFYGVGEAVREFIAGSCKSTLMKLVNLPEDKSEDAYTLQYRTVVREAGTYIVVSDSTLVEFPKIDRDGAIEFKTMALEELKATVDLINAELPDPLTVPKPRNKLLCLIKLLWRMRK
jgi:hypothetical protein